MVGDMIIEALFLVGYVGIGGVTGGVAAYLVRKEEDSAPFVVVAALLWPLAWLCGLGYVALTLTYRASLRMGRSIGHQVNRGKIATNTIRMMEGDEARGGSAGVELVLTYDYRPCPTCFGSGCAKCQDSGVVRVKRASAGRYAD